MLQAVGISGTGERLYRALLRDPQAAVAQLASVTGISLGQARRGLADLESAGLVSRRTGRPLRFIPTPPDTAIDALILRRREELGRCRLYAAQLLSEFRSAAQLGAGAELIEVISGPEAIDQRFVQMMSTAREEIMMFDRPPYIGSPDNPLELDTLRRKVTWRAIYAPEGLSLPGRLGQLRTWQEAGEQARVHPRVPLKLVVADRVLALLPLTSDGRGADHTAIIVRPCSLLTALGMLFDTLWAQSLPVGRGPAPDGGTPLEAQPMQLADTDLVRLLTAGFKDEAIARQLGVSLRTVRRRIGQLMKDNGATSRFQLGLLAARRGWT
jgi:DNA-binding Lrp family transcriptional regulator